MRLLALHFTVIQRYIRKLYRHSNHCEHIKAYFSWVDLPWGIALTQTWILIATDFDSLSWYVEARDKQTGMLDLLHIYFLALKVYCHYEFLLLDKILNPKIEQRLIMNL